MQSRLQLSLLQVQMEQKEKIHSSSLSLTEIHSSCGRNEFGAKLYPLLSIGNENQMIVLGCTYMHVT